MINKNNVEIQPTTNRDDDDDDDNAPAGAVVVVVVVPIEETWEERIQHEIDTTQLMIDQMLLLQQQPTRMCGGGTTNSNNNNNNNIVPVLPQTDNSTNDEMMMRIILPEYTTTEMTTSIDNSLLHISNDVSTTTATTATVVPHVTVQEENDATTTTTTTTTTTKQSIREHRRLSSILDQSPSMDIDCNSSIIDDDDDDDDDDDSNNNDNDDDRMKSEPEEYNSDSQDNTDRKSNNSNNNTTYAETLSAEELRPKNDSPVPSTTTILSVTSTPAVESIFNAQQPQKEEQEQLLLDTNNSILLLCSVSDDDDDDDSPEKFRHRRRHLVVENDDHGEGLNVITIGKLSSHSSSSSLQQQQQHRWNNNCNTESSRSRRSRRRRHSESSISSSVDTKSLLLNVTEQPPPPQQQSHLGSDHHRRRRTIDFIPEQFVRNDTDDDENNNNNNNQILQLSTTASIEFQSTPSPYPLVEVNIKQKSVHTTENIVQEEKKEQYESTELRHARFASELSIHQRPDDEVEGGDDNNNNNIKNGTVDPDLRECLSATESDVASLDGLPSTLQHRLLELGTSPRERLLQTLDGIFSSPTNGGSGSGSSRKHNDTTTTDTTNEYTYTNHNGRRNTDDEKFRYSPVKSCSSAKQQRHRVVIGGGKVPHETSIDEGSSNDNAASCGGIFLDTCVNNFTGLWNSTVMDDDRLKCGSKGQWDTTTMKQNLEVPLAILDCSNIIHQQDRVVPSEGVRVQSSFVRVARDSKVNPPYGETLLPAEADPRMQDWIANQYNIRDNPPGDGTFHLGQSRTVIVHEINRSNWTWCTAWSPDGMYLAVATDNHHLAVVDTSSSTVWRVRHDRKIKTPLGSNTTRSIRTIDWGSHYIAIGGTGNVVSILSPVEPYDVIHDIPSTGFVGCVQWRGDSNVLAIGSRLDFVMIVCIKESDDNTVMIGGKKIHSEILHKIEYKYWVNCVKFSSDGSYIAVGDAGGIVSVYDYEESKGKVETHMITWFKRKDSILSIEWSPDGKWLYAGGEDCSVTVVDTSYWEVVHRIGQDRWVQCVASSHGGSHVAIGGVSSEISILDVENGWDSVMGIELKGLVPLSAQWHPRDQYIVLTGQDNSVLAIETTNARHVKGHHLHSISPIRAIEFSPDGRMAVVGNEAGVVTFYSLSGTSFITAYELVIPLSKSINIQWSLNGMFVVVGSASSVIIVSRKRNKRQGQKCPPNASGFSVKKVIGDTGSVHAIAIDYQSQYIAVSGDCTRILDVRDDFSIVEEWKNGPCYANAWSPDGRWLAMMGKDKFLTIYDTSSRRVDRWRVIFSMKCEFVGRALAWGPLIVGGLLYLAYGGDSNEIYIMEIRTNEGTWETVLKVKRDASINALDWSMEGLLAAGVGNGTVCIIDLAYLQSGIAVNEMDYDWQRQALTCFTEIRRNRGVNAIKSLRWLPAAPGSDRLLAVGGTDGEIEIIDLTEQQRCKGYTR